MIHSSTASGVENPGGFIPPFPHRCPRALSPWQRLRLARKNLIAPFEAAAFEFDFVSVKVLAKRVFVCNSPQPAQWAYGVNHDVSERTRPASRPMRRPL